MEEFSRTISLESLDSQVHDCRSWLAGEGVLAPGARLADYEIVSVLGHGGMGQVYRARTVSTGAEVAIKVMLSHPSLPSRSLSRFRREAQLAARISHPNSLLIHDAFDIDGRPVVVSELAAGGDLARRLAETGPLDFDEALGAASEIAAGLVAAHNCGVLHRDLKPANCFIQSDGRVVLGDFGLSRSVDPIGEDATQTLGGNAIGTPAFASPEQLRGEVTTEASDIYSFGATIYCLLTGKPPYFRDTAGATISAVLTADPAELRSVLHAVPQEFRHLIGRCLASNSDNRPGTMTEVLGNLDELRGGITRDAGFPPRALAAVLDLTLGLLGSIFVFTLMGNVFSFEGRSWISPIETGMVGLLLVAGIIEGLAGSSIGKLLLGMRTVRRDGSRIGLLHGLSRTAATWSLLYLGLVVGESAQSQVWMVLSFLSLIAVPVVWRIRFGQWRTFADIVSSTRVFADESRLQQHVTFTSVPGDLRYEFKGPDFVFRLVKNTDLGRYEWLIEGSRKAVRAFDPSNETGNNLDKVRKLHTPDDSGYETLRLEYVPGVALSQAGPADLTASWATRVCQKLVEWNRDSDVGAGRVVPDLVWLGADGRIIAFGRSCWNATEQSIEIQDVAGWLLSGGDSTDSSLRVGYWVTCWPAQIVETLRRLRDRKLPESTIVMQPSTMATRGGEIGFRVTTLLPTWSLGLSMVWFLIMVFLVATGPHGSPLFAAQAAWFSGKVQVASGAWIAAAIIAAAILSGGDLIARIAKVRVLGRDGKPAEYWRRVWRVTLQWGFLLSGIVNPLFRGHRPESSLWFVVLALMWLVVVVAVVAISVNAYRQPGRSWLDRVSGSLLVTEKGR